MTQKEQTDETLGMLTAIVKAICRKTSNPEIRFDPDKDEYCIQVSGEDQGRLIGSSGRGFWALSAVAELSGNFKVRIPDQKERTEAPKRIFKANPHWDRSAIFRLAGKILTCCVGDFEIEKINETGDASATLNVNIPTNFRVKLTDPDTSLPEALDILIHAAGKADGAVVKTEVIWK